MRKRSEITRGKTPTTEKPPTTPASERTEPLPLTSTAPLTSGGMLTYVSKELGTLSCRECAEDSPAKGATVRADGTVECPACGAPLPGVRLQEGSGVSAPTLTSKTNPGASSAEQPTKPQPGDAALDAVKPQVFCNKCGAEWPRVDGRPFPNCGHNDGFVDDPKKAERHHPPAGHARPKLELVQPPGTPAPKPSGVPSTSVRLEGRALHAEWGKINFILAAHSSMTVGPFSLTTELSPGDNVGDVHAAMLAEFRKMAEASFDEQLAWYSEKLGLLTK